ncbi:hypothetical protein QFC22_001833 [Naganishia vaughanmartiniae]|uniref:Uncharacterized protein n=1 Tax=Naganishia vaughanmartiniae TaxID=1424756 RepID=A0ACC2XED7_9TREE|nr:hypothetical protein QFC22_001833 [Naganishia vaughanmartiniae]
MPPKKQAATDATPSKSLLNFFERSPDTHQSTSTGSSSTRKNNNNQGLKRLKGKITAGSSGTLIAPLVISDDEAVDNGAQEADIIDISDDDTTGKTNRDKGNIQSGSTGASNRRGRERSSVLSPPNAFSFGPTRLATDNNTGNTTNESKLIAKSAEHKDIHASRETHSSEILHQTAPTYGDVMDLGSQKSELEQALEEEEGQWNEGDEEGMGMEDLDIADEEDAFNDEVPEEYNVKGVDSVVDGGEKRKRKGKQKIPMKDCSPEIIAIEDSDSGGDDDSLGDREDVDDFDVDDDECPVCGRTFVGLQGDQKRNHVKGCSAEPTHTAKPNRFTKVQQPISAFCKPAHILDDRHEKDAEREREEREVKNLKGANAFKMLMSGDKKKEDEDWKVAESDLKRDGKRVVGRRKAPFYKVMTGMPIAVDAFRYGSIPGINAYFLTHAHSDHYTNLSGSWKHGPIYCSETTANLIKLMLGVDEKWVHGLPWNTPYELPGCGGVKVTVLKANHCPGSSLFLFEGKQTVNAGDSSIKSPYIGGKRIWRYLHCGDFRACPEMVLHPAIKDKKLDVVYLDTTYLNPHYCFPPQPLVIAACASLAKRTVLGTGTEDAPEVKMENGGEPDIKPYLEGQADAGMQEKGKRLMQDWLVKQEDNVKAETGGGDGAVPKKRGRTLVIMGTYSIGKERIVKGRSKLLVVKQMSLTVLFGVTGVARALNSKIYCDARKRSILMCQADPELHAMLTSDPLEATIHLVPLQTIQVDRLQPYLHKLKDHFSRVLAFRPTGWTYSPPAGTNMLPDINMVIRRDQKRTFTDAYLRPMRGSSHQFMIFGMQGTDGQAYLEY